MKDINELIKEKFEDAMANFLYYDRKEDTDLSVKQIKNGLARNPQLIHQLSERCRELLLTNA